MIEIGFTVTNICGARVPDLRPEHVRQYAILRIDGKETPFAQGGLYRIKASDFLTVGESETTSIGGSTAGWKSHCGREFTLQWEYCGVKSEVLLVDIPNRTAASQSK